MKTKQLFFTRRDAVRQLQRIRHACAKRERCHAPHASHGEQARRTRPSHSLAAPEKCSRNATHAQDNVFSMRGGRTASMKQRSADQAPAHLQRAQRTSPCACSRSCEAQAQWRRVASCRVQNNLHQRQAVYHAAVLQRQLGAAHAAVVACVSQCAAVGCAYGVRPCGRVWPRELRVEGRRRSW